LCVGDRERERERETNDETSACRHVSCTSVFYAELGKRLCLDSYTNLKNFSLNVVGKWLG
jgi:hypothetical protein